MSAIEATDMTQPGKTGPSVGEADALFAKLKRTVIEAHQARSDWRTETERAFDFVANYQWSEEDKQLLNDQNRPAVTFNRVAPLIKAVCGLEINNRQTVAFLPRKQGDVGIDEVRTAAAKWIRDLCDAEDEESEAFRDLTICGEGWTEMRMEFDVNPKGSVIEERIDPLEMGVNKGACRANYKDAWLIYRVRVVDSDDARRMFETEGYNTEALHADWMDISHTPADGGEGEKKDYPASTRAGLERDSGRRAKVTLVQVQWWERVPVNLVAQDGVDELQELSDDDFKVYQERVDAMRAADMEAAQAHVASLEAYAATGGVDELGAPLMPPVAPQPTAPNYSSARVLRRQYYEAFLGKGILRKKELKLNEFQFKAMTGERDRRGHCFYGMLRDMFDPQMWANKWLSQTLHVMNTNAKGGIMAETDAFVNVRKAERDWADNTKIIWVKPGSLDKNKIKERTPPPLPQGLGELMQFALTSLRDVTGVNLELLGQADREQAASLEQQRRQAAMTILATLFDSLRRYRKANGRLTLKFVDMLPENTLIHIVDKGQHKYVPLVKEGSIEEMDVVIDDAPSSPDQKQAIWNMTTALLSNGLQLPMPVIVKLLKYSPYPETVVQEITDAMGLGSELPPEMLKQKLDQAEQALQVLEQKLVEAQNAANDKSAEQAIEMLAAKIDSYEAETKRLQAMWTTKLGLVQAVADANATPEPADQA